MEKEVGEVSSGTTRSVLIVEEEGKLSAPIVGAQDTLRDETEKYKDPITSLKCAMTIWEYPESSSFFKAPFHDTRVTKNERCK